MTRVRSLLRWVTPYRARWLRERAEHARTREALAVVTVDRDALRVHWCLAVDQREQARAMVAALVSEAEWSESDEAFLRSLGERPG